MSLWVHEFAEPMTQAEVHSLLRVKGPICKVLKMIDTLMYVKKNHTLWQNTLTCQRLCGLLKKRNNAARAPIYQ